MLQTMALFLFFTVVLLCVRAGYCLENRNDALRLLSQWARAKIYGIGAPSKELYEKAIINLDHYQNCAVASILYACLIAVSAFIAVPRLIF